MELLNACLNLRQIDHMTKFRKVSYYTMERSMFRGKVWTEHCGSMGAVQINTPQNVSYERPAPGVLPPALPVVPKPTKEQLKARRAEEVRQKALVEQQKKQKPPKAQQAKPPAPKILDAEDKEKLPEFDIQDIPNAMDKIGWPTSAKLARKWFSGPKHIWNNDLNSVQPIDDSTVSLSWALKHGNVNERFKELLYEDIYSEKAIASIKGKILKHVSKTFTETKSSNPNLGLNTASYITDLRLFHSDWQVQQKRISTLDTLDGRLMTDLSGALGNFLIYAAIGQVQISGERYFNYKAEPQQYCIEPTAQLTHVYIYLKDNYSFNDKDSSDSQYLGHWNKNDMILSYAVAANDLLGQYKPKWKFKSLSRSEKKEEGRINWDYLLQRKEIDKPIDKRTGWAGKFLEKDVYWPVYNSSYNEWREKHNKGNDFMIYSKPQLYKLKTPIVIKLDTICRPYDNIPTSQ